MTPERLDLNLLDVFNHLMQERMPVLKNRTRQVSLTANEKVISLKNLNLLAILPVKEKKLMLILDTSLRPKSIRIRG